MTPEQESDFIGIKNSIYPLQDGLVKLENRVKKIEEYSVQLNFITPVIFSELEKRTKILEEARQRQIQLNEKFLKLDKPASESPKPERSIKSIWDLFKR